MQAILGTRDVFQPLEDTIRFNFLTALTGRQAFSDSEQELYNGPASKTWRKGLDNTNKRYL